MLKKSLLLLSLATAPLAITAPAYAQEEEAAKSADEEKLDKFVNAMMGIFDTENSEPIPEAQLALARKTTVKILPDGTYGRIMEKTFDQILTPMLGLLGSSMPSSEISKTTGVDTFDLDALDSAALEEISTMLDPNFEKRMTVMMDTMTSLLKDSFTELEPALREGMSRAYARKFSAQQLRDLNAFFETPTGAFYAQESFVLMADPEIMRASMQALPNVMESIMGAAPNIEETTKDIPPARTLSDLSDAEMTKLAGLLGVEVSDLEAHKQVLADEAAYAENEAEKEIEE